MEFLNQIIEWPVSFLSHCLDAARAIHMNDSRNQRLLLFFEQTYPEHEGTVRGDAIHLEPFASLLNEDDRRKRPERFAMLHPAVKHLFAIRSARVAKDNALPKAPR